MANFSYPTSDLDNPRELLGVLGSFWESTYGAKDQVQAFTRAVAAGVAQSQLNMQETADAISRHDLPVLHTETWYPIRIKKSELNTAPINAYKFDDIGLTFNMNPAILFDQTTDRNLFAFPVAADLVSVCQIFDQITTPTIALIQDVDFIIQDSSLAFTVNPFEQSKFLRHPVYKNGEVVDEEITLWAFKAKIDRNTLFNQFAYALNVRAHSTENFKSFVNTLIDGLVNGAASVTILDQALAAVFDIPLTKEDSEVVEVINLDNSGLFIATDKHVYRFNANAVPTVTVNQVLSKNSPMVAGFEIIEPGRGMIPDTLTALALDSGFTSACFYGDLVFENKDVPLIVDTQHPSGYTFVKFPLVGLPQDVQQFFDELHARGLENLPDPNNPDCSPADKRRGTLAHILSGRDIALGEPDADDLPATINPLKFITENVLRNNAFIVTVNISALGKNHLELYNIRHIRQLLPPHSALFISYTLDNQSDVIIAQDRIHSFVAPFTAVEPLVDVISASRVRDRGVTVKSISGTCQ